MLFKWEFVSTPHAHSFYKENCIVYPNCKKIRTPTRHCHACIRNGDSRRLEMREAVTNSEYIYIMVCVRTQDNIFTYCGVKSLVWRKKCWDHRAKQHKLGVTNIWTKNIFVRYCKKIETMKNEWIGYYSI